MRADFKVVVDANVLANFGVCDLLLRLAEKPRMFLPCWSEKLLEETKRTHLEKLGWPPHLAESFQNELRSHFPESIVEGFDHLLESCENDIGDRHVLACARHSQSEIILTFNLRDFPTNTLQTWKIDAKHPQDYLITLYQIDQAAVLHKLEEISRKRNMPLEDHLIDVGRFLPNFAQCVIESIEE